MRLKVPFKGPKKAKAVLLREEKATHPEDAVGGRSEDNRDYLHEL